MTEKQDMCFVRHYPDGSHKYPEAKFKVMLEFLVDNVYVVLGDKVFQQSVGIPMSTNVLSNWQTHFIFI
jgi:hypothetical protein